MLHILNFILGTIFASFITLCAWRLPNNISIVRPNSFCDTCLYQLRWLELIPIISFIFLNGRCAHCSQKISPISTLMELLMGTWFSFSTFNLPLDKQLSWNLFIIVISFCLLTDIFYKIVYPLAFIGCLPLMFFFHIGLHSPEEWTLLVAQTLLLLILAVPNRLGLGDVELILVIQIIFGFELTELTLLFSSISCLLATRFYSEKKIPFVPFIATTIIILISYSQKFCF